jgi:predicted unusual protein kinase regulating ubiquinone biosynthesis (AarF/ABC1/UbiB family)/nucleotide-binding universal stress UspA family protein
MPQTGAPAASGPAAVQRILVATDRSETADRAVAWAAALARSCQAELILLQVVAELGEGVEESLNELASAIAGERGRASVTVHADPPLAIVEAAEHEGADVVVVGNAGMSGRREFLLGNVPNRVSHNARCTVVIVNTMLDAGAEVRSPDGDEPGEERLLGRAARIGRVLAKHGLAERFGDGSSNELRARRLRQVLEELGPTFAKLGQILSTRPDLLPAEFVEELSALQDRVPPLTEIEVVSVMEQELGVPWEDVFATIDPEPLAAGTIGQVHRATLESGERVVVKVQRPTARDEIMRDLGLLQLFAEKAASRPGLREVVDIPALSEHLAVSLQRELDFLQEGSNIERMRTVLARYDRLAVPRVWNELSTPRLLVMEEVQGVPLAHAPEGPDRLEAARQLLEGYYSQILQDGFFHADPHPGNLKWWDGTIYFLDLGMVGEIDPGLRELMLVLLLAFWREDPAFLTDVILMLGGEEHRADLDLGALTEELGAFIARFRHGTLKELRLGAMLEGILEIAARHGVRLPSALALSGKAFAQMQLAVANLDPTLDPFSVVGSFLMRGTVDRVRAQLEPERIFYEGQKLKLRLVRLLEAFERATGARPGPKLQVEFLGTATIEDAIRRTGRRLALAVTAGAAFVATGFTAASSDLSDWVPGSLAIVAGLFTSWLAVEMLRR